MTSQFQPAEILDFWFSDAMRARWFDSTPQLDAEIRARFESLWEQAAQGLLDDWKNTPEGSLALIVVLDQLPLNMFRGQAKSFSSEQQAIDAANHAVESGYPQRLPADRRGFLFMPLMHSENLADQERSVALYTAAGLSNALYWANHHRELIRRFGRFPHRNAILGRASTPEELAYLASPQAFRG
ncbi:MAG: DUF924 domain-containing protein [Sulfuricella sp.]|nr:DUF924 domain-containing protein [Sulfuricella sp.]